MSGSVLFNLSRQSFSHGKQLVLDNINLTIQRGEKVALLGSSGSGKTTLLNLLHGLEPSCCAFQPQGGGLVEPLSVYQNIFMGGLDRVGTLAALWNLLRPLSQQRKTIEQLVKQLGLEDKLWHSVDRLSGGQRQRVAIGRALFRQQAVYLGDEPVSSLDPVQAQLLLSHILQRHQTAVVSLHQRDLALANFDRIVVLQAGRVCCDCPASATSSEQLNELYQLESSPQLEHGRPASDAEGWVIRTS